MNEYRIRRLFANRVTTALVILGIIFLGIVVNIFNLQVVNHKYYEMLAEGNRFKLVATQPRRGLIYDRNGELLATNKTTYKLEAQASVKEQLPQLVAKLNQIIDIDADNIELPVRNNRRYPGASQNIVLRSRLSEEEVAKVAVDVHELDGVEINAHTSRYYPDESLFSHLIGYVGMLSEEDIRNMSDKERRAYKHIGKTGVEKFYEQNLNGEIGYDKIEVNARGRYIRTIDHTQSHSGNDLMLTVDKRLQKISQAALEGHTGSVVVIDVTNGDVLASVSLPSFDPNLFTYSFSNQHYERLRSDENKPFFNRSISGQYAPGSTLKPILALAGLETRTVRQEDYIYAGPTYQLPGYKRPFKDWREEGHGRVNLSRSITQSCDVYFYDMANRMGIEKMAAYMSLFGLGRKTGIDTTAEAKGIVPTPLWKRRALNQPWLPSETIIAGIGQGYTLATPLQMAVATAIIANRGRPVTPRLVKAIRKGAEWKPQPVTYKPQIKIAKRNWDYVVDAMKNVVHQPNGTAFSANPGLPYPVAGKTGTVQLISLLDEEDPDFEEKLENQIPDHGMFVAFTPIEKPKLAMFVLAEHSGSGAVAARIALRILHDYFEPLAFLDKSDRE